MANSQLEDLFRTCDKKGTGLIGPEEFRELCAGFEIGATDSDAIFDDLDHDGDGKISMDDFAWGFKNFLSLSPGSRRGSIVIAEVNDNVCSKNPNLMRRQSEAHVAWSHLVAGVGEVTINKFLNNSGRKLADLYQELQIADTNPQLVTHFEGALSSLVEDVKKLHDDNQKLEEMFIRERENHLHRLRGLEEELDAQVAKVEAQAQEEAKHKFDQEKRVLVKKMEAETLELKTHLKLFQKVNDLLSVDRKTNNELDFQSTENENLRLTLSDTKANLELVRAEMVKLRSEYERKCKELSSQQELLIQYINKSDHVYQQLRLLQMGHQRSSICSGHGSDIKAECSGTPFGIERLMEDFDSGRSTLKDAADCDSETKSVKSFQDVSSLNGKKIQSSSSFEDSCRSSSTQGPDSFSNYPTSSHVSRSSCSYSEANGPPEHTFKILFAGDAAVGKTHFIHRFCKGFSPNRVGSTVGVDFQVRMVRVNDRNIALNLWDTAGQERFRSLTRSYFRRSDGVMLLYDVTSERSYLNIRQWIPSIEEISEKSIPIIICGNKVDIRQQSINEGKTCVMTEQGLKLAEENSAMFFETSSRTGQNISEAVIALTREMLLKEEDEVRTSGLQIKQSDKPKVPCCGKK